MQEGRAQGVAHEAMGPTIVIGEILVEIMATTPGDGFLEPQTLTGPYPSGAPAIFIDQVARLGGSAGIVAAVGDDDFGRCNTQRLHGDGVDVSAVAVVPDYPTGSAFVRYRHDGGRDFVFNIARSAAAHIGRSPQADALIARAGHLHVMGTALTIPGAWDVFEHALSSIKARGGSVSVDPNIRKELLGSGDLSRRLAAILAMADLVLPSGEELLTATGAETQDAALASLFSAGTAEVVLKRGSVGATCFRRGGGRVDAAAFEVDEIDPTGAGDCFGAAYLTCRRLGFEQARALDYANAAGARNVTVRGPMEGAGTFAELDAFMNETRRKAA